MHDSFFLSKINKIRCIFARTSNSIPNHFQYWFSLQKSNKSSFFSTNLPFQSKLSYLHLFSLNITFDWFNECQILLLEMVDHAHTFSLEMSTTNTNTSYLMNNVLGLFIFWHKQWTADTMFTVKSYLYGIIDELVYDVFKHFKWVFVNALLCYSIVITFQCP